MPNLVWMRRRAAARGARPLTERECLILDRIGRDPTHKDIAAELGVSINTVANLAANPHKKPGVHGAAAAVTRTGTRTSTHYRRRSRPILERLKRKLLDVENDTDPRFG